MKSVQITIPIPFWIYDIYVQDGMIRINEKVYQGTATFFQHQTDGTKNYVRIIATQFIPELNYRSVNVANTELGVVHTIPEHMIDSFFTFDWMLMHRTKKEIKELFQQKKGIFFALSQEEVEKLMQYANIS